MNLRKLFYFRHTDISNNLSELEKLVYKKYKLKQPQLDLIRSENKYTIGILPRRCGKTFSLLVDAIYNSKIKNKKVVFVCHSNQVKNKVSQEALNISKILNINLGRNDIIFTSTQSNLTNTKGYCLDMLYLDEFCFYSNNVEDIIISHLASGNNCKLKALSSPGPRYNNMINNLLSHEDCIEIKDK